MALGIFGLVSLVHGCNRITGLVWLSDWHPGLGGPMHALNALVPSASVFRYPAKWLPFVSLGLAVAAARGWSCGRWTAIAVQRRIWIGLLVVSLAIALAASIASLFAAPIHQIVDVFWGPLRLRRALWDVAAYGLLTTGISAGLLCTWHRRNAGNGNVGAMTFVGMVLLAIQLGMVAKWQTHWVREGIARRAQDSVVWEGREDQPRFLRVHAGDAWPGSWSGRPSDGPGQMAVVYASQRMTRFGRWHLSDQWAVLNDYVSIQPGIDQHVWRAFLQRPNDEIFNFVATPTEKGPPIAKDAPYDLRRWMRIDGLLRVVPGPTLKRGSAAAGITPRPGLATHTAETVRWPGHTSTIAAYPQWNVIGSDAWANDSYWMRKLESIARDEYMPDAQRDQLAAATLVARKGETNVGAGSS
ncbi:MAG: hypothetical protein AAFP90_22370, partial [Planctomycetota bacterium]